MAARSKGRKKTAWKDGSAAEVRPEFQPEFLGALNRLVRGHAAPAPDGLLVKVFAGIDQASAVPCVGDPVKALALRGSAGSDACRAEARTKMQLLENVGRLAAVPEGGCQQDAVLSAVEHAHQKIESGAGVTSFDMAELNTHLPKKLKGFAGVPALHEGRVAPSRWGLVEMGTSHGVFIEYGTCLDTCDKNMLLAFNTKNEPDLETVQLNGRCYWMTRHENHTLAAWRGEKDGWLYILVTHCPFRNALALAALLRE